MQLIRFLLLASIVAHSWSLPLTTDDESIDSTTILPDIKTLEDTFMLLAHGLRLGDPCDPSAGVYLERLAQAIYEFHSNDSVTDLYNKALETVQKMVARGLPMCDPSKLLICSNETSTCICGNLGIRELDIEGSKYIVDGSRCAAPVFTYCWPPKDDNMNDDICQSGSFCRLSRGRDASRCNSETLVNYFSQRGYASSGRSLGVIMKSFIEDKICQCLPLRYIERMSGMHDAEN